VRVGEFESGTDVVAAADLSAWTDTLGIDVGGLLGADAFGALPFAIDYSEASITFIARDRFKPPKVDPIELKLLDRRPGVEAIINQNIKGVLLIDTGVQSSLQFDAGYLARNPKLKPDRKVGDVESVGIAGIEKMVRSRVARLEVLGRKLSGVSAAFPPAKRRVTRTPERMGLAGGRLLRDFHLTFDYHNQKLWAQWKQDNPLAGKNAEEIDLDQQDFLGRTLLSDGALDGNLALVKALINAGIDVSIADKKGRSALFDAVRGGNVEIIDALIASGTDVNVQDKDGETALMLASVNGQRKIVAKLIASGANHGLASKESMFALYLAAANGHQDIVADLLDAKADMNFMGPEDVTALMVAADRGHVEVVAVLVKSQARINQRDGAGYTALMYASQNGHKAVVAKLLAAGADVNGQSEQGQTALSLAKKKRRFPVMRLLLDAGAR